MEIMGANSFNKKQKKIIKIRAKLIFNFTDKLTVN
jgi:hypothetical protein